MATDDSHDPRIYPESILANRDSREESGDESVGHNLYSFFSGKINQTGAFLVGKLDSLVLSHSTWGAPNIYVCSSCS